MPGARNCISFQLMAPGFGYREPSTGSSAECDGKETVYIVPYNTLTSEEPFADVTGFFGRWCSCGGLFDVVEALGSPPADFGRGP